MLTATSFLFTTENGIQEVRAAECSYLSYKELCLVCPKCGEPVILAALNSDKQAPHFRHRKLRDDDGKETISCPNRVHPLTEKELNKFKVQNRNQRINLLRKHFWHIVTSCLYKVGLNEFVRDMEKYKSLLAVETDLAARAWKEMVKSERAKELASSFIDFMQKEDNQISQGFLEGLNLEIHKRTLAGVFDFLAVKSCYPLLERLILYGIFEYSEYNKVDPIGFPIEPKYILHWALSDVIGMMVVIPWQEAMYAAQNNLPIPEGITRRPRLGSSRGML